MSTRPSIKVLPPEVSEKIAAGEVVERPLSVVKELVENSIDAQSTSISVDIEDGGQRLIRVIDNGCGMTEEELELAVLRFATSKIRDFGDLECLTTLGFRGEALPSIAAVSSMEILSRTPEAIGGHCIHMEGGQILELREAAAEAGTRISVKNLFFNTPARKKFLKSPVSEAAQISHYLSKMVLANRSIHFKLTNNDRAVFNFPPQFTERDCLVRLWQLEDENDLMEVSASHDGIGMIGYLCHPRISRGNKMEQFLFVNRRLIKSNSISAALGEGFQPFIPQRRFPLVLLFLEIPPSEVDVNVHPAKTEIRFCNERGIFRAVKEEVAKVVRQFQVPVYSIAPPAGGGGSARQTVYETPPLYDRVTGEVSESRSYQESRSFPASRSYQERRSFPDSRSYREVAGFPDTGSSIPDRRNDTGDFLPLAQLYDTYIIGEMDGELWILDQHASHERVTYERLQRSEEPFRSSQGLLFAEALEFSAPEAMLLEQHLSLFQDMGFQIEHFGGDSFVLRGIPPFITTTTARDFIRDVLTDLGGSRGTGDLFETIRKSVACRGSIQAGQKMTPEEMRGLIADLLGAGDPFHCPHGRPTLVKLARADLEKLFKRK